MKRLKLRDIELPAYVGGEERLNTVTHIIGALMAAGIFAYGLLLAHRHQKPYAVPSCWIYGLSMIVLYTVSSVYHGLPTGNARKIMRVVDHCTIYLLIAGSYTPVLLVSVRPRHPALAWGIFAAEWGLGLLAALFTAMDMKRYGKLSMACYIAMGWLVVAAIRPVIEAVSMSGFLWLLAGGIAYTLGAVLYGIGKKKPYFHAVFHIFVVLGSLLQAVCILKYVL